MRAGQNRIFVSIRLSEIPTQTQSESRHLLSPLPVETTHLTHYSKSGLVENTDESRGNNEHIVLDSAKAECLTRLFRELGKTKTSGVLVWVYCYNNLKYNPGSPV